MVYSRRTWEAKPPRATPTRVPRYLRKGFFIHHTVTVPTGQGLDAERAHMRYLQEIAFSRGFADISYNFVVFPSGNVYRGRGWEFLGAHNDGENEETIGIVLVGNFELSNPTKPALDSAARLIKRGRRILAVKPRKFFVKGHRDTDATACPGKYLYAQLDYIRRESR